MICRSKQAFFLLFLLSLALAVYPCYAAGSQGSEDTLSLGELWEGVQDFLPRAFSSENKKDEKKKGAEESSVILAKKNETTSSSPSKPSAPYKVYSAPQIEDGESDSSLRRAPRNAEEEDKPEPVVEIPPSAEMKESEMPPLLRRAVQAEAPPVGTQFFPVLPRGAGEGALPQIIPVASNYDLAADMTSVTRVVLVVHDLSRNASDAVTMMTTLAGADQKATLILSPQFLLANDIARFASHLPEKGKAVVRWPIGAEVDGSGSWQTGGLSSPPKGKKGVSSFTVIDLLLLFLADRHRFPNLERIVMAGHGMGADFVQRYAAVGLAPDLLNKQGLLVSFLLSNPSTYLYLTSPRPDEQGMRFGLPDATACPRVNTYPYGLEGMNPYVRRSGVAAVRARYPKRHVMLLLSEAIKVDTFLDMSCAARAQGVTRLERGRNFARYMMMSFGEEELKTHSFTVIPGAGYDPVTVFGSYCGQAMLLGDGVCGNARKTLEP